MLGNDMGSRTWRTEGWNCMTSRGKGSEGGACGGVEVGARPVAGEPVKCLPAVHASRPS